MRLDDRLALRDGIEDLRDTVRDIIPYDILDEERSERDTDDWRDKIPPRPTVRYQLLFYQPLNEMDERLQQRGSCGTECTYEEGEQEH